MLVFQGITEGKTMFPKSSWERNDDSIRRMMLGLPAKVHETDATIVVATNTTDITNSWALLNNMTATHRSKTGKVLVLFSCRAYLEIGATGYHLLEIKLQKNGVDIQGGYRSFGVEMSTGDMSVIYGCMDITHIDTAAKADTWRILVEDDENAALEATIGDRRLIIMDLV